VSAAETGTPESRRQRLALIIGCALAAAGAILFSTKAIAIKLAYAKGVDTETLLALRMGLALPFYLGIGVVTWRRHGTPTPLSPALVLRAAAVGILGYWVASYTDFLGLNYISATFERLILFTYPLFVVLIGAAFFGGRVGLNAIVAFAIAYLGLAVIFLAHPAEAGGNVALGAFWVTVSAITFALYQLLAKDSIARLGPALFTSIAMSGAAVMALAGFLVLRPLAALGIAGHIAPEVLFLVFGATIIPSYLLSAALARISAAANGVIGMVSPLATIVFSALLLGERLGPLEWGGTALVVAGVAAFVIADRRP